VVVEELTDSQTGGSLIQSYQIDYDRGSSGTEWQELKGFSANDVALFYIEDELLISTEYRVRYRAKNIFGWSDYSDTTSIYTIMVPDVTGDAISSDLVGTNIIFSWTAPFERGTPITHYNVQVNTYLDTYLINKDYCKDIAELTCSMPMSIVNDL
jgi:hypothetical protein